MCRAQNADTLALKQPRLSQNISPVCSSVALVIASGMHLESESEKRAKNVDFHTAINIQIQPTLFRYFQTNSYKLTSDLFTVVWPHPSYSNCTVFRFLNGSNTKLPEFVTTQSLVPPPLTFLNYCSCTALLALYALHQTHAHSNSDASTAKLMAFALSPISVLISGTTSPKMSDTLIPVSYTHLTLPTTAEV